MVAVTEEAAALEAVVAEGLAGLAAAAPAVAGLEEAGSHELLVMASEV